MWRRVVARALHRGGGYVCVALWGGCRVFAAAGAQGVGLGLWEGGVLAEEPAQQ